jgi:hypothetical protein
MGRMMPTLLHHACKLGLEGFVSKRKDRSGRSPHLRHYRSCRRAKDIGVVGCRGGIAEFGWSFCVQAGQPRTPAKSITRVRSTKPADSGEPKDDAAHDGNEPQYGDDNRHGPVTLQNSP